MNFLNLENEIMDEYGIKSFIREGKKSLTESLKKSDNETYKVVERTLKRKVPTSYLKVEYVGSEFHFDSQTGDAPYLIVKFTFNFNKVSDVDFEYVVKFDFTGFIESAKANVLEVI